MPPTIPRKPVGSLSSKGSMRIVICPSCRQKAWGIILKDPNKVRTTCHGKEVQV